MVNIFFIKFYSYIYSFILNTYLIKYIGASHADELFYLFYNELFGSLPKANSPEYRMCRTMCKLWCNFAKTGYVS